MDSLGRQPTETGFVTALSRDAATDSRRFESAAASRLNVIKADLTPWTDAQGYLHTLLRNSKSATSKPAAWDCETFDGGLHGRDRVRAGVSSGGVCSLSTFNRLVLGMIADCFRCSATRRNTQIADARYG